MSTVFADPPSTPASQSRPQHHHFIPQFVLRTFSPSLQPRTNDNSSPSPRSWKQAKSLKKNASVNFYDIADESLSLQRVAKIYGHRDLYRVEFSHGEGDGGEEVHDPNHVEKKLAQLESQAAVLFKRIRDDADGGKEAFDISRRDKDILRKFLYIMKYRGELFGKKYTLDSINEDHGRSPREKAAVRKLMAEKGFTSLKQVWAHHLRVIMDTPIDCEGNWRRTVRKEMVFDNAENFIAHIDEFFMAFVKPLHPATDEFIVTDNGFGVFEGTVEYDTPYGLQIFEYHNLAPISPRLMLVLRKNILRDTQMNKGLLKLMRSQAVALPGMPPLRISLLEDLPVSPPATPNITALSPNRIPKFTDDDKFVFEISRLSQRHVHRINSIMLTEARSGITFLSTRSMEMSLKAWINDEEFITSTAHPQYADMIQLRQAKIKLLHKLSGDPASVTPALELPTADNNANDYLLHYYKLGGTAARFDADLHDAIALWQHRDAYPDIKIRGAAGVTAQRKLFSELVTKPSSVIYLHIKLWGSDSEAGSKGNTARWSEGPEDLVVKLSGYIGEPFRSRLMLEASWKYKFRQTLHSIKGGDQFESQFEIELFMFSQWGGIWSSFLYTFRPDSGSPPNAAILSLQQRQAPMVAPDRRNVTSSEVHSLFETNLILSQELLGKIDIRFLSANVPDGEQITMQTVDWLGELLWVHLYPLGADIGGRRTAYETLGTADQLHNSSVTKEMQGLSLK